MASFAYSQDTVLGRTVGGAEARLLGSALTLFSEKGYNGTSIREIIERAGVTRPVLYYYFENKEALFGRLIEESFAKSTVALDRILATMEGCRERLKALMRSEFENAAVAPQLAALVLQAFFSRTEEAVRKEADALMRGHLRQIARIFEDGLRSNELRGGDPDSLALAFAALMDMHILAKLHAPEAQLTDEFADALVDLFLDGACSEGMGRPILKAPFFGDEGRGSGHSEGLEFEPKNSEEDDGRAGRED